MKNRGYAASCRTKRIEHKGDLEQVKGKEYKDLDFVQEETNLVINLPSFLKVFKVCPSCQWASVLKLKNVNAAFNSSYLDYLDEDKIKIEVNKT